MQTLTAPADFHQACQTAGVTAFQERCASLLLSGLSFAQVAVQAFPPLPPLSPKHRNRRLRRMRRDVREALDVAARLLMARNPEVGAAGEEFARQLVQCVANRGSYDERPAGVSGVAPAPEAKRFQGGRIISGDDPRLRQSPTDCLLLWSRAQVAAG